MLVRAIRLGKKISLRELQKNLRFEVAFKEPFVLEYSSKKFVVIFRYGVVVFWGLQPGDINHFLSRISPYVVDIMENQQEEQVEVKLNAKKDEISPTGISFNGSSVEKVAIVSEVLGRSVVLDSFEHEVDNILVSFGDITAGFAAKGKTTLSSRTLLKKVGEAMSIQHLTVNQMAMLDKPDLTWEDASLNKFYRELADDYEIKDRYSILDDRLQMIFKNIEFILNVIDGRRSLFLEIIIVFLILFEILIFIYEKWFM